MYFIKKTISNKIVRNQRKSYIILHVRQTSMDMKHISNKMFLQKES